jgi:hypothetical protein
VVIHDHASAIRGHDLQSASRRCGTPRRRLDLRHNPGRHKSINLTATKLSFAIGLAPREQKLIRNPMMPCCRRHQPRPRETFRDDPQLLGIRPAPTPASIYNVKATHLTTISKDIHTDSQLQTGKNRKAAVLGRVRTGSNINVYEGMSNANSRCVRAATLLSFPSRFSGATIATINCNEATDNAVLA